MENDRISAGNVASVEARWQGLIREQQESGQPVKVFCAARGLAASTFFAWRRKLMGDRSTRQPGCFVELIPRHTGFVADPTDRQHQHQPALSATAGSNTAAGLGPAGLGPAGLGPAGLGPAGLGPAGLGPAVAAIELELREGHRPVLLLRRGFDALLLREVLAALAALAEASS